MTFLAREEKNPIIVPGQIRPSSEDFEVIGVFNPGVTTFRGKTLLLMRVAERPKCRDERHLYVPYFNEATSSIDIKCFDRQDTSIDFSDCRVVVDGEGNRYLTSFSSLLLATSENGVDFEIDPAFRMAPSNKYEAYGIEDARIVRFGDTYFISYTAASQYGICTAAVTTEDFVTFSPPVNIMCPDNKDISLFPEKIGGKYYAIHRPSCSEFAKPNMWLAQSDNLAFWGDHKLLMSVREGMWDSARIGASSVPIRTDRGWLVIYHGADESCAYRLGAALFDGDAPEKLIARSREPFLVPDTPYERNGFVKNVVFACGSVVEEGTIRLYYGAADKYICLARIGLDGLIDSLEEVHS